MLFSQPLVFSNAFGLNETRRLTEARQMLSMCEWLLRTQKVDSPSAAAGNHEMLSVCCQLFEESKQHSRENALLGNRSIAGPCVWKTSGYESKLDHQGTAGSPCFQFTRAWQCGDTLVLTLTCGVTSNMVWLASIQVLVPFVFSCKGHALKLLQILGSS